MWKLVFLTYCWLFFGSVSVKGLRLLQSTTLGQDPQTVNRLNGESFQQDALVTFNGYQYAVFWTADASNTSVRHPSVSRRGLQGSSGWETFTLSDYDGTDDDGHDVISLGISQGDGTLHIGFDQHDNPLRYRVSKTGIATHPTINPWSPQIFGPTLDYLPGLESLDKNVFFINVTYPRFLSIPTGGRKSDSDLLFEIRVGRSGLGDDWLYRYTPGKGWAQIGRYLENHDMDYAYSHNLGETWMNNWNQQIANSSAEEPILPVSAGITVFSIPKYGGILNQEAQTIDAEGRIHVLNRENTTGVEQWYHYWRSTATHWTRTVLPPPSNLPSINNITGTPTVIGKRGKLVAPRSGGEALLAILPSNAPNATALSIIGSTAQGHFRDWKVLWEAVDGCVAEPLFDRYRLEEDGVLSLFLVNGTMLQVEDFEL
ncbi:hypothetical protein PHLCEN_2v9784 [Hermanssonia centrifuga]|uniref:Uncharacterized protein n=1 Tax=Hermanssonia centrifuga TaxID=98765 RepID=A0A2R6NPP9_9APHY|nr:hypothetical protein PHLCEN_2v9784 [Hermanssonia centrifuga]